MTETAYEEIGPLKGKHVVLDIDDQDSQGNWF